jgi:hypothetical protein
MIFVWQDLLSTCKFSYVLRFKEVGEVRLVICVQVSHVRRMEASLRSRNLPRGFCRLRDGIEKGVDDKGKVTGLGTGFLFVNFLLIPARVPITLALTTVWATGLPSVSVVVVDAESADGVPLNSANSNFQ